MNEIQSGFKFDGNTLRNEICRCFGVNNIEALVHKGTKDGAGIFLGRKPDTSAIFKHELTIKTQKTKFKTTIPEETSVLIDAEDTIRPGYLHHLSTALLLDAETSNKKTRNKVIGATSRVIQKPVGMVAVGIGR
ncbi:MAG: hypothetical protein OXG56_02405 [Gammaproteobacteria bacterium]|nr:hypothetical protein [Gammaproteobacteria bacterium]